MPIKPELRKFYKKHWRTVVRPRILARAGNCCERCKVPNRTFVLRAAGWWTAFIDSWRRENVICAEWVSPDGVQLAFGFPSISVRQVGIVLTVAHLNHVSGDDRDDNLQALCQWCHLTNDLGHHKESRAIRKDLARPLLAEMPHVGMVQ